MGVLEHQPGTTQMGFRTYWPKGISETLRKGCAVGYGQDIRDELCFAIIPDIVPAGGAV